MIYTVRMTQYQDFFQNALQSIKQDGSYRTFTEILRTQGQFPHCTYTGDDTHVPQDIITWCSNDYMGMGQNPDVLDTMASTLSRVGAGAGGTRNIGGTTALHTALENILSTWHNKPSALVFTSGWVANLTILSTLGERLPRCIIYSDSMNHNSMIEGMRRARCEKRIFKHNDSADLERLIKLDDGDCPKIIACESVYSMDGDIAPLADIVAIAKKYNALTYVDEVHAVGMYGATGAGVCEQLGLSDDVDIIQGTLGKAIGQFGGYMAASADIVDFVRSFGNGFIFTTSLPPAVVAGATKSIHILMNAHQQRIHLHHTADVLKQAFISRGVPVLPSTSHIVPVSVIGADTCRLVSKRLLCEYGYHAQPINYPTVARGTERLRFSPSPLHTQAMIDGVADGLAHILKTV